MECGSPVLGHVFLDWSSVWACALQVTLGSICYTALWICGCFCPESPQVLSQGVGESEIDWYGVFFWSFSETPEMSGMTTVCCCVFQSLPLLFYAFGPCRYNLSLRVGGFWWLPASKSKCRSVSALGSLYQNRCVLCSLGREGCYPGRPPMWTCCGPLYWSDHIRLRKTLFCSVKSQVCNMLMVNIMVLPKLKVYPWCTTGCCGLSLKPCDASKRIINTKRYTAPLKGSLCCRLFYVLLIISGHYLINNMILWKV